MDDHPLALTVSTAGQTQGGSETQNSNFQNSNFGPAIHENWNAPLPSGNPVAYKFVFTFNNPSVHLDGWDFDQTQLQETYTHPDLGEIPLWCSAPEILDFLANPDIEVCSIGLEQGESGTLHLQGAFAFNCKKKKRWRSVRSLSPILEHYLVPQRGRGDSAYDYCKKDGNFVCFDKRAGQGSRSDLASAIDIIKETGSLAGVIDEHPEAYVRFHSGLARLALVCAKPREGYPVTFWLYGETGTNKTRTAYESVQDKRTLFFADNKLQWFDGYDPGLHKTVVFDDLRATEKTFAFLLLLLDRYPMSVPFKGGTVQWNPSQIFITTPVSPYRMFRNILRDQDGAFNQLYRRVIDGGGHFVRHTRDTEPVLMTLSTMAAEYENSFNGQFAQGFTPPPPQ